jgi:hypothetical protein
MANTNAKRFEVLNPREATVKGEKKTFWDRCGVAFENKDGSINVRLHQVPLNGELQLRVPKPKDPAAQDAAADADDGF